MVGEIGRKWEREKKKCERRRGWLSMPEGIVNRQRCCRQVRKKKYGEERKENEEKKKEEKKIKKEENVEKKK